MARLRELANLVPGLANRRVGTISHRHDPRLGHATHRRIRYAGGRIGLPGAPAHLDAQTFVDTYAADTISVDFDPTVPSGAPVEAAAELALRPTSIPERHGWRR